MSWLPRDTELGDLSIGEIFVNYDGPRVFVSRAKSGQSYLVGWAEEGASDDLWLYLLVSDGRLQAIRDGKWTLRDAYLNPEGPLFTARLPRDPALSDQVEAVSADELRDDWLPAEDFRLRPAQSAEEAMTPLRALLAQYAVLAPDTRTKGFLFERLIQAFLTTDPEYNARFDEVWLWQDWPGRDGRSDTGIDLVARERFDGGLCAIQCKFFAADHTLDKKDIDSFFTASGKIGFTSRLIVSTTDKWSRHATDALTEQQIPTARLGIADLETSEIDWSSYQLTDPSTIERVEAKSLREHQRTALNDVLGGFDETDRGKLIMACGTGKTFTSLRIAEKLVPAGGNVLFLVPSIALLSQSLKEWSAQSEEPIRAFAVCSDSRVGRNAEDLTISDLSFPATTKSGPLLDEFNRGGNPLGLTVFFSTYQSIQVMHDAQAAGLPDFDLIVCDEAHRTTGVTLAKDDDSNFVRVHDAEYLRADKRLYMTATPRIFGEVVKAKAKDASAEIASMDDEGKFGPEFHRLSFGKAVERDLLTDYRVLVLAVSEEAVSSEFQNQFALNNELNLDDAAKVAGIYKALSKSGVEGLGDSDADHVPMRRAVAFSRSIKDSLQVSRLLDGNATIPAALATGKTPLVLESRHVDGTMNVLQRTTLLDWLQTDAGGNATRILTNARCLSEGVDVPSLDAVIFLNSRDSQVDVVQSVGRVMRKSPGKAYGYIILPVAVPAGVEPEQALSDNKKYKVVWEVLRALRAHDERFEAKIESLELNQTKHDDQIQVIGVRSFSPEPTTVGPGGATQVPLDFTPLGDEWRQAVYAKIVQKVGEREYWENWASSVANVATSQTERIRGLVETSSDAGAAFARFLKGLRDNLNPGISASDAMEMLSQHLITQPVLEALFENFSFAGSNPVARVMQEMLDSLEGSNVESETQQLDQFYESVRTRVRQITDPKGKQEFLKTLYQRFFSVAMKRASERFGIVYTPTEIVDFILRSADELARSEFGKGLGDKSVHVLDPFTGTGTFLVRLLQLGLISDAQLPYKYREELHANEISLLAYYVAAVNIEEAYHQRMGGNYVPFKNILLTDTFQMHEDGDELDGEGVFAENNAGVIKQKELPITVIIGNPPYSVGQESANDENSNTSYSTIDGRIAATFAASSAAALKRNLYDSYVRAFRWAMDRVEGQGVVAFVTNGSFIESGSFDGFRKTLAAELSSVHVLNLRGNARGSGERRRREAGNVFGSGTRTTVAIALLVKGGDDDTRHGQVFYSDIGDDLTRDAKLQKLRQVDDLRGVEWTEIAADSTGDWIGHRSDEFQRFEPMTTTASGGIFRRHTNGLVTGRDAWVVNFSRSELMANMRSTIDAYRDAKSTGVRPADPRVISWSRALRASADRKRDSSFDETRIEEYAYRPFTKELIYLDRMWNEMVMMNDQLYPPGVENRGIFVVNPGESGEFSALAVGRVVDLHLISSGQVFPRFTFERPPGDPNQLGSFDAGDEWAHVDNITDQSLEEYRNLYGADVSKDDIFDYVYGVLHSPEYRGRFATDLKKMLPRIPKVREFRAYRDAGNALGNLHINYEGVPSHPALVINEPTGADLRIKKMRWKGTRPNIDQSTIIYNDEITISGIPDAAHEYMLGSRSALEWVLERYQVKVDKASQIKNDPNDWGLENGNPRYILDLIGSIVNVSTQTVDIVKALPPLDILETAS